MTTLDTITKARIQKRVSQLVKDNVDSEGFVSFEFICENIVSEFGIEAIEEAKKQYDFMYEW